MPGDAIRERKAALRRVLRAGRARVPPEIVQERSGRLAGHLMASGPWRDARVVAAFMGVGGEPDLRPLLVAGLASGKRILLPRIASLDPARMVFGEVKNLDELMPGRLGIPVPSRAADVGGLEETGADLVLVPGVAFGRDGSRLGQGKGFYDAALARLGDVITIGIAFDAHVDPPGDGIPMEPHDVRVRMLATESGLLACSREPEPPVS